MKLIRKKLFRYLVSIVMLAITAVIFLSAWYYFPTASKIVIGGIFSLFMPGLFIGYMFFPHQCFFNGQGGEANALDLVERQIMNVFLSVSAIVLTMIGARYLGIELTAAKIIIFIVIINIAGIIIFCLTRKYRGQTN